MHSNTNSCISIKHITDLAFAGRTLLPSNRRHKYKVLKGINVEKPVLFIDVENPVLFIDGENPI